MGNLPFGSHSADWFSEVDEEENPEIDEQHDSCEDPRNDTDTVCLNPCENRESKPEGQSALASNENTEQFSRVTIITIDLFISYYSRTNVPYKQ